MGYRRRHGRGLVAAEPGIGPLSAAQILLSWSHTGRIRNEAAFAMLSGTAVIRCAPAAPERHSAGPSRAN
jgi:hypothetical protein